MPKELHGKLQVGKERYGIVISRFNDFITNRLLDGGWDRRLALLSGLVMLFGGAGALLVGWLLPVTFTPSSDDAEMLKLAGAFGAIPLMASFGLLLYYRFTAPKS